MHSFVSFVTRTFFRMLDRLFDRPPFHPSIRQPSVRFVRVFIYFYLKLSCPFDCVFFLCSALVAEMKDSHSSVFVSYFNSIQHEHCFWYWQSLFNALQSHFALLQSYLTLLQSHLAFLQSHLTLLQSYLTLLQSYLTLLDGDVCFLT